MLRLFATILLVSTTLGHPVEDSSSGGLLKRSKRRVDFELLLRVRSSSPSQLTVFSGSSQFIECEAGGYPSPSIYWLKDGQRLSKSELSYGSTETPLGMRIIKSRLYLDDVTPDQAGSYTCVAENSHSSRSKATKVSVVEESYENGERSTPKPQVDSDKAARIQVWTSNNLEPQGIDLRLYCRSEVTPSPTIVWLNPMEESIEDGDKYQIHENGDLTIKSLSWEDMGEYTCRSENTLGSDSAKLFVYPLQHDDDE